MTRYISLLLASLSFLCCVVSAYAGNVFWTWFNFGFVAVNLFNFFFLPGGDDDNAGRR